MALKHHWTMLQISGRSPINSQVWTAVVVCDDNVNQLQHIAVMCKLLKPVCGAGNRTAMAAADMQEIASIVKHNAFGSGNWFKPCLLLVPNTCSGQCSR